MKRLLLLLLSFSIIFLVCCEKQEEETKPLDDDKIITKENIIASHVYNVDNDEVNPYLVVKGLPYNEETIDYTIIIFLNFPKNYKDNVLIKRFYNYLQCDYYTDKENTVYYHNFDHNEDDGGHLSNAIKFVPRYNTSDQLTKINCLLEYEYELESNKVEKEIKFEENILLFEENKFSDIITNAGYSFDVLIEKRDEEDFNRYKLVISLDSQNTTGHYDIQTWVKCKDRIIPFVGYYHYRAINGDINSVSDEKIAISENVSAIYYMVRYYDESGNVTDTYYVKGIN